MIRPAPPPLPAQPDGSPYLVPWAFDRSIGPPRFALDNVGSEVLHAISFHLLGSGTMLGRAPLVMRPGDRAVLMIHDDDLARNTVLVVRWFRPNGDEYLWRVSF